MRKIVIILLACIVLLSDTFVYAESKVDEEAGGNAVIMPVDSNMENDIEGERNQTNNSVEDSTEPVTEENKAVEQNELQTTQDETEAIKESDSVQEKDDAVTDESETVIDENEVKKIELRFKAHVQNIGWGEWKNGEAYCGSTGKGYRMEALVLDFQNDEINKEVQYRVHVQNIGWSNWVNGGEIAGTTGKSLRIEAIQIRLSDWLKEHYELYYKAHVENFGDMAWTTSGNMCGTEGFALRMEAAKFSLIVKNKEVEPDCSGRAYLVDNSKNELSFSGHVQNRGDINSVKNGGVLGTVGCGLRMEAINIIYNPAKENGIPGTVNYSVHVQNIGWQGKRTSGQTAGTTGQALRLEALQINLEGEVSRYYDVYYRVHVQDFGWLGWAKNGSLAGTEGFAKRMEAVQIVLQPKYKAAPGYGNAFYKVGTLSSTLGVDGNRIVNELKMHEFDNYYLGTRLTGLRKDNLHELLYPNGDRRSDGFAGMNCTGFIAYVYRKCGADLNGIGNMGRNGSYCNGSNWYRFIKQWNLERYEFNSVSELLRSGKAKKGDLIYCEPKSWLQKGADCHLGFFWGDTSYDNRFWHSCSVPRSGNQISEIVTGSPPCTYILVKLQ